MPTHVTGELGDATTGFPAPLARELRAESVQSLGRGTSPARVWRVTTPHAVLAVKVLRRGAGLVDGQDIGSFLKEPAQLQRVRRELPRLAPHVVDVLGVWQQTAWAAYAMPFVAGAPAVAPAVPRHEAHGRLNEVFTVLTEHGYARTRRTSGEDLSRHDLSRVRRRLWLLRRHLHRELLEGPRITVNGASCRPLVPLLHAIEGDASLSRLLRPRVVSYPVHGELDLADLLAPAASASFTLLDPRGTQGYRDPVEDFARALFSMTTLDRCTTSGVRLWRSAPSGRRPASYVLRAADPYEGYAAMGTWFVDMLGDLPFGAELTRIDPRWRVRLAFAHGFHALVEATARLSAPPPDDGGGRARTPVTLATAFCALGLRLLEAAIAGARQSPGTLPDVSTGLDDPAGAVWRFGGAR
ncbi:MAG TPA: hypothetical protein VK306_12625 [Acidimicrobiales bacterium]|nr:hypothetical protein [Acidimicrobiales bacterium]